MKAAAILADAVRAGLTIAAKDGRLAVTPASRLPAHLRDLLVRHRAEILTLIETTETSRIHRAWRLTLANGTRVVAIRPAGATRSQILEACADQFGNVIGAEPAEVARP